MQGELVALRERLQLSEQHGVQLAESIDKLRSESDEALRNAHNKIVEIEKSRRETDGRGEHGMQLVDVKTMQPIGFSGKFQESYKQWAKKVKAFCNARKPGFRQALEWAELESTPIDRDSLGTLQWDAAEAATNKLYDLLVMLLSDDPLVLVENHPNNGFEAWRALSRRYDPVGETFTFDKMTSLLSRERCKDIGDLPAAIERWTRDLQLYERKTGQTLPREWRVPIIFQMVPKANFTEVKSRWQLSATKDITKFAQELVVFANDLKHEQAKTRGPTAMEVDSVQRDYTDEEWDEYVAECQATLDWVGKGGGKGGKSGRFVRGGKGKGKGQGRCHWCNEDGHLKMHCKKFELWKKNKDDDRKRKGLPPFKPRGVASIERDEDAQSERASDYEGMLADDVECGNLSCDAVDVDFNLSLGEDVAADAPEAEIEGDWDFEWPTPPGDSEVKCECCETRGSRREHAGHLNLTAALQRGRAARARARASAADVTETSNKFEALADDEVEPGDKPLDVVGVRTPEAKTGVTSPIQTSPWSTTSHESLAESIAREQKELAEKLNSTTTSTSKTTPISTPTLRTSMSRTPTSPRPKIQKNSTSSTIPSETSMEPPGLENLKGRKLVVDDEPKVPTVDVETQTDIHLDHCVRSITWIPMPDEIEPVYEEHDGLAERAFDEARQPSSINDVDDVEADDGDADERMWPFYSDRSKLEPRVCADEGLRVLDTRGYSAHARTAMSEATPEETAHDAEQHAAASDWVGMASTAMIVILVVVKMLVQAAWMVHKGAPIALEVKQKDANGDEQHKDETSPNPSGLLWAFSSAGTPMAPRLDFPKVTISNAEQVIDTFIEAPNVSLPSAFWRSHFGPFAERFCLHKDSKQNLTSKDKVEDLAVDPVDLDKIGEDRSKMRKVIMPGKVRLKRGITVDSGSHHNVMPRRMVKRSRIRPSEGSKRGLHYVAANKGRIPNEGETDFKFETEEGELEDWTFQIAEVNKALASIADRVDHGYRVTFDKDEKTGRDASYMLHKKSKKIIKMTRHGNVWRVEAIVDVDNIDEDRMPASFARQG